MNKILSLIFVFFMLTQHAFALGGQGNAVILGSPVNGDCLKSGGGVLIRDAGAPCGGGASTPGGNPGDIQFNDSGTFGGSDNLFWDNADLKFGIGTSSPRGIFDISNFSSIDSIASGSATQINNLTGNLTANGSTFEWYVYAYKNAFFGNIYSSVPLDVNVTDNSDGMAYWWQLNWASVSNVDGYIILVIQDPAFGQAGYYLDVGNSLTSNYGDGTESSYVTPAPAFVTTEGPNLFIDSTSGDLTSAAAGNFSQITGTSAEGQNYVNGAFLVNSSEIISGLTDASFAVINPSSTGSAVTRTAGAFAKVELVDTVAPIDQGHYQYYVNSTGQLSWGMLNDAENVETTFMLFNRTGRTPLNVQFLNGLKVGIGLSPSAMLDIQAGTTAAGTAPLKFNSGNLLSSAEVGAVEFLTDKFYGTITTGPARKEITLNDSSLTSGRIPFATTNGRLTDSSALTFSGSTLTSTNIAATTFTGDVTLSTHNLVTDTTTGTKIGTATTQKLGFFNATPVVQQTGNISTALSNEGLVTSGTLPFSSLTGSATAGQLPVATTGAQGIMQVGGGLAVSSGTVSSNAVYSVSFQPGLLTSVTSTKGVYGKISKASTVDNIEASAILFTCVGNPTITLYECGTSTTCATPTTIGSATVTTTGTVVDGTISSASITAGDYIAWAISAGTCTSLDIAATAQIHSN